MALNFPHPPPFQPHLSEDRFMSPFRGASRRNSDEFGRARCAARDVHGFVDYGGDDINYRDPQESVSNDILDLLPADPFGMDISSTFTAAITGWFEELEADYGGCRRSEVGINRRDLPLFAGWNLIWNNTIGFGLDSVNLRAGDQRAEQLGVLPCDIGSSSVPEEEVVSSRGSPCVGWHRCPCEVMDSGSFLSSSIVGSEKDDSGVSLYHGGSKMVCNLEDESFGNGSGAINLNKDSQVAMRMYNDVGGEPPHAAFAFALGHLGVYDLLSIEKVCKSLRYTVQNDPLLWRTIHIDQQLSERITDDILLQLTNRAQGKLDCLSLVECTKITDDGLRRVLDQNTSLTKLSAPGCTRLSVEGVVSCLTAFNSGPVQRIKCLRIGGLYGMTEKHFEDLKALLGTNNQTSPDNHKPHFYKRGNFYLSLEDDRPIDIEMCPRCQNFRILYDCPADTCHGVRNNHHDAQVCRACIICVPRCVECGRCIENGEFEETFCLELLCSECGEQLSSDCRGRLEIKG